MQQLRFLRTAQHDQASDRCHEGTANALHCPRQPEFGETAGQTATQGGESKHGDRSGEHIARAEPVGQPAAQRHERRRRHQIDGYSNADAYRGYAEALRHLRQRGVDDRAVEQLHEERAGDDQPDDPHVGAMDTHGLTRRSPWPGGAARI